MEAVETFFAFSAGIIIFMLILAIAMYVLYSLAIYWTLRALGHPSPIAAFIPFWNQYAMSQCVDRDDAGNVSIFNIGIPGNVFNFWFLISFAIGFIPVIGGLASLVINVICMTTIYQYLYAKIRDTTLEEEFGIAIASAFIGIIPIIRLWCAKNM